MLPHVFLLPMSTMLPMSTITYVNLGDGDDTVSYDQQVSGDDVVRAAACVCLCPCQPMMTLGHATSRRAEMMPSVLQPLSFFTHVN